LVGELAKVESNCQGMGMPIKKNYEIFQAAEYHVHR
jgi:hypothetical protein